MRKKTVLHVTHTHVPSDARILRELEALSSQAEYDVHVYGKRQGDGQDDISGVTLTEVDVASEKGAWRFLPRPIRYVLNLLEINTRFIRRARAIRPDIIHCHDTMVLPTGASANALFGSTVVYDAHELESNKNGQTKALSVATLWIEKLSWKRISALITVSPAITDWYNSNLGPKKALCVLNSPMLGHAEGGGETVRQRTGLSDEVPLFIYVGVLGRGRGIEQILGLFTQSQTDKHIAFIGYGPIEAEILALSQTHANIHFCGRVPHDELVGFIQGADGAFVIIEDVSLSDHFCLPNKLFEYAFAGIPVIASKLPEITRVVQQYRLGTCVDLDRASLEAAVAECLGRDRPLPTEHLTDLSWQTQAQNLTEFYRTL